MASQTMRMDLRRRVVTAADGVRKELVRDDASVLRALIDSIDYGRGKYRPMRRSMDRLYDALVEITLGQTKAEDATAFIEVTPEQLEHLNEVVKDPPSEGQNATVHVFGAAWRKLFSLVEDTHEEWKKSQDGKPERVSDEKAGKIASQMAGVPDA